MRRWRLWVLALMTATHTHPLAALLSDGVLGALAPIEQGHHVRAAGLQRRAPASGEPVMRRRHGIVPGVHVDVLVPERVTRRSGRSVADQARVGGGASTDR